MATPTAQLSQNFYNSGKASQVFNMLDKQAHRIVYCFQSQTSGGHSMNVIMRQDIPEKRQVRLAISVDK